MTFNDFNSALNKLGYFAEADRQKMNGAYRQLNRVHVFKNGKPLEIAKINEKQSVKPLIFEKLSTDVEKLVVEFGQTLTNEREMEKATSKRI